MGNWIPDFTIVKEYKIDWNTSASFTLQLELVQVPKELTTYDPSAEIPWGLNTARSLVEILE